MNARTDINIDLSLNFSHQTMIRGERRVSIEILDRLTFLQHRMSNFRTHMELGKVKSISTTIRVSFEFNTEIIVI
jgi:hypothetical protein